MRTEDVVLVEREYELNTIDSAIERCAAGAEQLLLVEGAPGLGKTSLMGFLHRRVTESGFRVLTARGQEIEEAFPYGVVRQLFEDWLATASPEERDRLLSGPAKAAAELLEQHAGDAPRTGEAAQHTLFNGLYWLCVRLAEQAPLALSLDDAWRADLPSLRFLRYLAARLDGRPILLALSTDPARLGPQASVIHGIVSHPAARLLRLAPLSERGIAECVRDWLGKVSDPRLASACHQVTGGSPFFLRELIDELSAAESGEGDILSDRVFDVAPPKVMRSVLRQLEALQAPAVALVEAMAVLGTEADLRHSLEVAGIEQPLAAEALGALADSGLLCPEVPPRFVYPIVRTAIYHQLPVSVRSTAHARAARILAADAASLDDIAQHVLRSDVGGCDTAVELLRRAAGKAVGEGRAAVAVTYLTRALHESPSSDEAVDLLTELGRAELRSRMPDALGHLRQALDLSDDPLVRGRIGLDLAAGLMAAARNDEAVRLVDGLRAEVGDLDPDLGMLLDTALIALAQQTPHWRDAAEHSLRRLHEERDRPAGVERILAVDRMAESLRRGEPAARVGELADQALNGAFGDDAFHAHDVSAYLWSQVACTLACCDRLVEADRLLTRAAGDAHESGRVMAVDAHHAVRAWVRCQRGRLAEAEADARQMLDKASEFGLRSSTAVFAVGALIEVHTARNEFGSAKNLLRTYDFDPAIKRSVMYAPVLFARGRLHGAVGDLDAGVEDILHGGQLLESEEVPGPALLYAADAAILLHRAGRTERAQRLVAELTGRARHFGAPRLLASALRAEALMAMPGPAVGCLEEAAELLTDTDALLDYATVLVDLGAALRRRDRLTQARRRLNSGLQIAQDCGAWRLVKTARSELSAMGVRVRVVEAGADSLTVQERRVADLAAEGVSNREIAGALFVTVKTVEWHLNRAYRKLSITSRHELAEALAVRQAKLS
ncbi:helix-turn-helix transcriptional regulator [Streptomyces profundus]|uniref:helix-turn-helix transcriptional regulator n=1 Tax=Streptomyces profundus TaxID=2867410 RepID=UPI001D16D892|nr:LuxR family transcriptional regulator [Streptomyces sp. MA3_2.13]UED87416.1 AAA family ATPase [Streptomyces sp. MA3_2.13]